MKLSLPGHIPQRKFVKQTKKITHPTFEELKIKGTFKRVDWYLIVLMADIPAGTGLEAKRECSFFQSAVWVHSPLKLTDWSFSGQAPKVVQGPAEIIWIVCFFLCFLLLSFSVFSLQNYIFVSFNLHKKITLHMHQLLWKMTFFKDDDRGLAKLLGPPATPQNTAVSLTCMKLSTHVEQT